MLQVSELLNGNETALNELRKAFIAKGWAFVKIPKDLLEQIEKIRGPLKEFFAQEIETKDSFTLPDSIFGYQRVNHKESLRWLTCDRFTADKFPETVKQEVIELTKFMDDLMLQLVTKTTKSFFDKTPSELGDEFDLALVSAKKQKQSARFGMLDVAHYLNLPRNDSDTLLVPPKNCVEHYDPGLFSLSFFSSQPGLQLLDLTNDEWIDGPCNSVNGNEDVGIIWCGAAIAKIDKNFKPAIHRVEYPEQTDGSADTRMAIWYEVCTSAQETDYQVFENTDKIPPNVFPQKKNLNTHRIIRGDSESNKSEEKSWFSSIKSLFTRNSKSTMDSEFSLGVPRSKSMKKADDFVVPDKKKVEHGRKEKKETTKEPKQIKKRKSKMKTLEPSLEYTLGVPESKSMIDDDFDFFLPDEAEPERGEETEEKNAKNAKNAQLMEFNLGVPPSKSMSLHTPQFGSPSNEDKGEKPQKLKIPSMMSTLG